MDYEIKTEGKFKFIETGGGKENLVLIHGLFGALSNFKGIIDYFGSIHNVVVPILPIFELPIRKVSLSGLVDHLAEFFKYKKYSSVHLMGNSLGGHLALLYVLADPDKVKSAILTGSSGLFENSLGSTFPKRGDYEFIKKKAQAIFYNPEIASKELVDEVFNIVNDRNKAIRIIATAKSAVRHNLGDNLHQIHTPTLLVWGKQDSVTPQFVGEKFHELISGSTLRLVDECGHAPMMEKPKEFNHHLEDFLNSLIAGENKT